jgi:hypothetical protein
MECSGKVVKLTRNIDVSDIVPEKYARKFNFGPVFKKDIPPSLIRILSRKKCNLLEDEVKILRNFDVNKETQFANLWKAKDGRISAAWKIVISDRGNMKRLYNIKIPLKKRAKQLEDIINSYKRSNLMKIKTYRKTVNKARKIESKKRFFTRKDIINYYKSHSKWADRKVDRHLKKLVEKNIISKNSKGEFRVLI